MDMLIRARCNYFKKISKNLQHDLAMDTLRRFIHTLGTFRPRKRVSRSNNKTVARPGLLHALMNRKPIRVPNHLIENVTGTTWLLKDAITNDDIPMAPLRGEEQKIDKQTMLKISKVCHLQI